MTKPTFPPEAFDKADLTDDALFYASPRLVTHIDEGAIIALTSFYAITLPAGGIILDLMSSWVSHLPDDLPLAELIGHGMNRRELDANPRLTRTFVQNLNDDPGLPLDAGVCDGALCCVGVQYLQRPIEVFADVRRVLKRNAPFVVSFSNHCFPTKAVAIWRALQGEGHAALIQMYMKQAGFATIERHVLASGATCDPLVAIVGRA